MAEIETDTIAALATPPGRGGIAVVRVSGPRASEVARAVLPSLPPPRAATLAWFRDGDGELLDRGIAIHYPAPHSYTGEDVLELQSHGGAVLSESILTAVRALGVRLAEPGEFTRRAWLNDKLDLAQAEAVADLIDSATTAAARAAVRSLSGAFSEKVHHLVHSLTELRMHVEAAIDFPEEDIDFLSDPALNARLTKVREEFDALLRSTRQGQLLRDGLNVVIAGRPNAGKSSLLNRLAGHEAAIVTDRAGTTRDVLREDIQIDGLPLKVIDTAGLRDSDDPIEQEGVRRAREALAVADQVLIVIDSSEEDSTLPEGVPDGVPVTRVRNKIDLTGEPVGLIGDDTVNLSAQTGDGLDALREHLKEAAGYSADGDGELIARRRHLDALHRAREHLERGTHELKEHAAGEIMAEELRLAQASLGEITGRVTSDDLLGEIFGRFCIGK